VASAISHELQNRLADLLRQLPVTETFEGRSILLQGTPNVALNRSQNNRLLDLDMIVGQWAALGRDKQGGVRPLVIVANNALRQLGDWESDLAAGLRQVRRELEDAYAGDNQPQNLPPIEPEKLLFAGRDERVPAGFLARGLQTAGSICRLRVPRLFAAGESRRGHMFGTGWLIAPSLLITNHHVIDARQRLTEPPATPAELAQQAAGTVAWFDYLQEGGAFVPLENLSLAAGDEHLDYALLRLESATGPGAEPAAEPAAALAGRRPLPLVSRQPDLPEGTRLNIVQHSGGGPLVYAIRNNFYVGAGDSAAFLRYLTDTEPGASGSPVLTDDWRVVALHHAARPIPPQTYASLPRERRRTLAQERDGGEVINYHNEGIAIHAILDHLPAALRAEIAAAQGW